MSALTIIIFALIASAFASGAEIAFLSSNKLRIELDRKQGSIPAQIIWRLSKSPSRLIAMLLIANNLGLVVYSIAMSEDIVNADFLKAHLPHEFHTQFSILVIQTFLSTLIILVTAEFIPKALFRIDPNRTLSILAVPIQIIYIILYPVIYLILAVVKFILKTILRMDFVEEKPVFGRVDLDFYVKEIASKNDQEEERNAGIQIFQNALDFTRVKVRECMVPRKDIVAISVEETTEDLRKRFAETKHSRILVYRDSVDNIVGFVHSKEMFQRPHDIMNVLLPIAIVPEAMPAHELLQLFIDQRRSVAVVVDEFGGTSGVVTMEDVMEEIFGEIRDEHDTEEGMERKVGEGEYIFSGALEIDMLNRKYDLNIPESEGYETLAGYILHHHENIPAVKEEVIIPPFTFTILQVKENRIEQVKLKLNREE